MKPNLILSLQLPAVICEVCRSSYFTKTMVQRMQCMLVYSADISQSSEATPFRCACGTLMTILLQIFCQSASKEF